MELTETVNIKVQTQYLAGRFTHQEKYPFAYKITITNKGDREIQLINRFWLITDGNGKSTEVRGEGVVGEQPHIKVGESFQYSSGAILDTPVGTMQGFYEMQDEQGNVFKACIDVFSLAKPHILN
jgi:ApaG protein